MEKVLIVIPLKEKHRLRFRQVSENLDFIFTDKQSVTMEQITQSNIIIGNVEVSYLAKCNNLKWIQLNSAGVDAYVKKGAIPQHTILTNASGAYGLAISEHMLGMLLAMKKKLFTYYDNMKKHVWRDEGEVTSIYGANTLVVGLGDIGSEFAKKMHALGSDVYGIRQNITNQPEYLKGIYQMDQIHELLPKADIVALTLPGTKQTYHLFDRSKFDLMKDTAVLINVGRGSAISENDLCEALHNKKIAGAMLDVTEKEPIDANHALWNCPNLMLTPHISGDYHLNETLERIIDIAFHNLTAYVNGQKLKNIVDREKGY